MSFMGRQSRLLKTLQFCTRSHLVGDSCSNKGGHKVSSNLAKPLHHTNCCRICAYVNSPFGTTTSKADMFLVARAGMSTQECVDRLIPMIIDAVMPLDQAEQEEFSGIPTTVSGPLFKVKAFPVSLPITTYPFHPNTTTECRRTPERNAARSPSPSVGFSRHLFLTLGR